jgi:hypothetical protein
MVGSGRRFKTGDLRIFLVTLPACGAPGSPLSEWVFRLFTGKPGRSLSFFQTIPNVGSDDHSARRVKSTRIIIAKKYHHSVPKTPKATIGGKLSIRLNKAEIGRSMKNTGNQ